MPYLIISLQTPGNYLVLNLTPGQNFTPPKTRFQKKWNIPWITMDYSKNSEDVNVVKLTSKQKK